MNVFSIGSAAQHAKMTDLKVKWKERKNNLFQPQKDPKIQEFEKQLKDLRHSAMISSIRSKAMSGTRLSPDEKAYLRKHDPEQYDKVVRAERERDDFKKRLQRCRSKEEVEQVKQQKMSMFCSEVSAVSNNAAIPDAKMQEIIEGICMRMAGVLKEDAAYRASSEYQSLPDRIQDEEDEKKRTKRTEQTEENEVDKALQPESLMESLQRLLPEFFAQWDETDNGASGSEDAGANGVVSAEGGATTHAPLTYDAQGAARVQDSGQDERVSVEV